MVVAERSSPLMKESVRAVKRLMSSEIRWSGLSAVQKHFKTVVHLLSGPFGKIVFRHPFPPAKRQALLQVVAVDRKSDVGEGQSRETEQPAVNCVAVIILQSAVKRIEPFV